METPAPEFHTVSFRMTQTLTELCGDVLALIVGLRRAINFNSPDELKDRIRKLFKTVYREGSSMGIPREDLERAKYLLIGFIDESILISEGWTQKAAWRKSPMQLEEFETRVAGEVVFKNLEEARQNASEKTDLLELYFTCLSLGFKGQLAGRDKELQSLLHELWVEIQKVRKDELPRFAPQALPAQDAPKAAGGSLSLGLLSAILGISLVLLVVGLNLVLGLEANEISTTLRRLL